MQVDLVVLLGVISTILGILGTAYKFKKDGNDSVREATAEQIALSTKLDYIIKIIDDIKLDFKSQDNKIKEVSERLTKVEESVKSAHHRLDSLELKKEM